MSLIPDVANYGKLSDSIFIHDNAIGYDFSDKADVTFIQFNGLGNLSTPSVAKTLIFWKNYFYSKLRQHVNVINIRDGNRDHGVYSANYLGIPGLCASVFELANLLNDKLYLKGGSTRKVVVFADCGGTIPAILTSTVVPYHSLNLTTPYLKVIGSENEFDTSEYAVWVSRKHSLWVYNELTHMSQWFDTVQYLDYFTQNPNVQLNMHWATNIIGTDLMFRNTADILDNRPNVTVTDHVVPANIEGHMLNTYLVNSRKLFQLVNIEIQAQFAALGTNLKNSGR